MTLLRDLWRTRRTGTDLGDLWRRHGTRPRVWAHRGDSAHYLENTMPAFAAAVAAGADGTELDVRLSKDGHVMVFHDDDLLRLAGRSVSVEELTRTELADIRLANQEPIPLLTDVLAAWPRHAFNVEIKTRGHSPSGLPQALAALLRTEAPERILVSSFSPVALAQFTLDAPRFATAFLFDDELPGLRGWPALAIGAHVMHPEQTLVDVRRMKRWCRLGYPVNTFTVDAPVRLRELSQLGVDGVFCNDPAAAIACLTQASA